MSDPDQTQKKPWLALLLATGFGLGYVPKAPGTAGSLLGLGLAYLGHLLVVPLLSLTLEPAGHWGSFTPSGVFFLLSCAVAFYLLPAAAGVWAAGRSSRHLGSTDPAIVVIDEVSGQQLALFGFGVVYPAEWKYLLAGFILFRVFDIWKPWPVRRAEKLPGGSGIMADDWVAGIYAALGLWLLRVAGM
jgi:phosphatidylglycerophosphatase A